MSQISLSFVSDRARSRTARGGRIRAGETEGRAIDEREATTCCGRPRRRWPSLRWPISRFGVFAAAVADFDAGSVGRVLPGERHRHPRRSDPLQPDRMLVGTAVRGDRGESPGCHVEPVLTYAYVICVGIGTTASILADYCWAPRLPRPTMTAADQSAQRHGLDLFHRTGRHGHGAEPVLRVERLSR